MHHGSNYLSFVLMALLSFVAMYALMYAMVDAFGNVIANVNQAYMAGLMTAAMAIIELVVMRRMYPNAFLNIAIAATALIMGLACWFFIRSQAMVDDRQFLASMIPHHGAAILMCEQAPLEDEAVKALCERIKANQQLEIDWMQGKLDMLEE